MRFPKSKLIWLAAVLLSLSFIFGNSLFPGQLSSQQSERALGWVLALFRTLRLPWVITEYALRKAAHFAEYALLGVILQAASQSLFRQGALPWSLFLGLLIPLADETLQLSVPGRTGLLTDVLLDFSGVLAGIVFFWVIKGLFFRRPSKSSKRQQRED